MDKLQLPGFGTPTAAGLMVVGALAALVLTRRAFGDVHIRVGD